SGSVLGAAQPKVDGAVLVASEGSGTVTLELRKELVIKLASQAGTGFTWRVSKNDEKVIEPVGKQPTVEKDAKSKVFGGPTLSVFRFRAVATGYANLELEYVRPSEQDAKPAKTFRAAVTVVRPGK